jgi:Domain of unknown function (DUF4410)
MSRHIGRSARWLFILLVLTGCASTKVTEREAYTGEKLARPDRIIVHDFAATPAEVHAESALPSESAAAATPQTAEDVEVGRKVGAEVAKQLVADLQGMRLPAVQAPGQPPPRVGDLVIKGSFVTVEEGGAGKRVLVGFGSGAADLRTVVEGYLMTAEGLRKLGGGEVTSEGSKTPGMVAPLAVAAATANPIGLLVVGGMKLHGQMTGSSTIEGRAKSSADEIAAQLKVAAEKQGWI